MRRSLPLLLVAFGVCALLAGCTPGADSDPTLPPSTAVAAATTTTAETTTTEAPNVVELFLTTISDPRFAATIDVVGRQETSAGTVSVSGAGAVEGTDSSFRQKTDFSGLDTVLFEARTRQVVGPGATTELVDETRLLDAFVYNLADGNWTVRSRSETDGTTLGYVISMIATTDQWANGGPSNDDPLLTILTPSSNIEYDPTYWSVDPGLVAATASTTEVLVSAEGFPSIIRLNLVFNFEGDVEMSRSVTEYILTPPFTSPAIEIPDGVTVSLQQLNTFYSEAEGDGLYPFFDFAVPVELGMFEQGPGFLGLGYPDQPVSIFFAHEGVVERATLEETLPSILEAVGMTSPEVEDAEYGGFPAVIATEGERQLFYTVFEGTAGVIVMWQGSTGDVVADRRAFEDVLSTLEWTSSGGVVPGSSIAGAELQTDTIPVVETVAIATHDDCGGASVVDADVIGGDGVSWIESWTVQTCGGFDTYSVTFIVSSAGGTSIAMEDEPEASYGHTHES